MTEFSQQIIFKKESFLNEENIFDSKPNAIDKKCGEIILLANTEFWFLCTFCNERFHSIVIFENHVKGFHITDADVLNTKDENPLDLHPNEKCDIELGGEGNCNDEFEIKWTNNLVLKPKCTETNKSDCDANIGDLNSEVEVNATLNKKLKNDSNDCKNISTNENITSNRTNGTVICKDIEDLLPTPENVSKKRNRKKKVYSCPYCQHIALDKIALEDHMQSNHGTGTRYQCEECGKCFRDRSNLRSHLVIHSGTRPYKCDFCDAGFSHSNSLKAHRYLHTGDRPFKCIECDKGFVSSGALKIHMREHTGETPYDCQVCGKAFATQCSYKRHMISHSGRRAYKCKECEKAFLHKETLMKHMSCHSTEKNFVCDSCPKKFNDKRNLIQHQKLHLKIKQYICKVCNKDFAQNAGLYSHMKCHRNKE